MANIYSAPEEIGDLEIDWTRSREEIQSVQDQWLKSLRQWVKKHGSGSYAGEIVRDQVADGYAQYMVVSLRPLNLIHLPLGDAWQSRWAHRWTAADVKQMVEREKALRSLFANRK